VKKEKAKVFPPHALKAEKILKALQSKNTGLTTQEAEKRLGIYGANKIEKEKKESPLKVFLSQFQDFLIVILLIATGISFALGEVFDGIIIFSIVFLSAVLGFIQEYRSQKAIEALKKLAAPQANVLRDNRPQKILAEKIVPGDILILNVGDKVAADARIVEEIGLETNESILTGESSPVKKQNIILEGKEIPLADRINMVYSGTIITRGHGKAVVTATGMNTEFGKIAKMISEVEPEKTPLEKKIEKVGKALGIGALTICAFASLLGVLRGYPILEMFLWGVSLAVAAVPEALPAVVTSSLSLGVWEMAKRKAIVRRLPAVETLGSVSVICTDKTGTLTKNEMTVKEVFVNNQTIFVEGSGYTPKGGFLLKNGDFDFRKDKEFLKLAQLGLLCNDATLEQKGKDWIINGDPTEGALVVLAAKANFDQEKFQKEFPRIGEIAFDMSRKRMSTFHPEGKEKVLIAVKGAPESILQRCSFFQTKGEIRELTSKTKNKLLEQTEAMASRALRVLAFAYKETEKSKLPKNLEELSPEGIESDLIFVGLAGMIDPPREEAAEAIKSCLSAGIKPIIVTGDHALTTLSIGQKIGLFKSSDHQQILTPKELDSFSDDQLIKIIEKKSYARVSPTHKLRIVNLLKQKGYIVAMTGDGINDAPAIKKADIGVAMGISGTDVTRETADMILADDNFATIVAAIKKGREIFDNIKKYLFYLFRCNIGEILVLGGGFLFGLPPVLSTIQILWINLATDGLPAIALGVDPPTEDVLKRKPISPSESIFSKKSIILMFILAFNMLLVLIPQFGYVLSKAGLIKAQTIVFVTMVLMEMVNSYNSRSDNSLFKINPFANSKLNLAVAFSVLLTIMIVQVPYLSSIFGTTPLVVKEWLMVVTLSLSALVMAEIAKLVLNKIKV